MPQRKPFYPPSSMRTLGEGSIPTSKVPDTTGWKNVQYAYSGITSKLKESAPTATKVKAIDYWIARLNEDRASITSGSGPLD